MDTATDRTAAPEGMTAAQQEKFDRMTATPIPRLIARLAVPTTVSMLVTAFYNLVDTLFVGKLENVSATGAVGVVLPVMAIIQAFGFFFGQGSGNFISRSLGARNTDRAERMAATGFFSALACGAVLTVLGLAFLEPLAKLLGSTPSILPYAKDYLLYILLGAPFMAASMVLNNQLRFQGNAFYSMIGLVSGAVLNIGLDPLFIFVWDMGVAGAALATVLSQTVSFTLLLIGTFRSDNLNIRLRRFTPRAEYFVEIARGGTPSLFRQALASLSTVCLNLAAGAYAVGDEPIAAMTIVSKIMLFALSALLGFGQGFQPVCGFNYGAQLYGRVKEAFWFCVRVAAVLLVAGSAVLFIVAPWLIALFQGENETVVEIGTWAMRAQTLTFPLMAWVIMSNMMLQNTGNVFRASLLALSRQGLFFVPAVLLLPRLFGLNGIILAQPISDICAFGLAIAVQAGALRDLNRRIREQA